jgi:hypothetical protein
MTAISGSAIVNNSELRLFFKMGGIRTRKGVCYQSMDFAFPLDESQWQPPTESDYIEWARDRLMQGAESDALVILVGFGLDCVLPQKGMTKESFP